MTTNTPDLQWNLIYHALQCADKQWRDCYKIGYFKDSYLLDINSAYPNAIKNLYDTRQLEWICSDEYEKEAVYGFCRVQIDIPDHIHIHPIIYQDPETQKFSTPTGTFITYLSKSEIDFIHKWDIAEIEIISGWWGLPRFDYLHKPMYNEIERLLKFKKHENPDVVNLIKAVLVGIYGKFGQELRYENRYGDFFNPVWFAEASIQPRLEVADFIYRNNLSSNLLHIGVDSIRLEKCPKTLSFVNPYEWKSQQEDVLVLNQSQVFTNTSHPQGLYLNDVIDQFEAYPNRSYYSWTLKRMVKFNEAVEKNDMSLIGKVIPKITHISLLGDNHTRNFESMPRNGKEALTRVYTSVPEIVGG